MAKIESGHILGAAVVTLIWSAIIGVIFGGWFTVTMFMIAAVSALLHPVIGKTSSKIIQYLCKGIDWCYNLDEPWGNWPAELILWVAVFWPLTLPIMTSICGVGLLFGIMYKILFLR